MMQDPHPIRRYEKGERRFKHVGKSGEPELRPINDNPRHVIGLCPNDVSDVERTRLLNLAVPLAEPDRDLPVPKKVYAVFRGAIYEAQTSDRGTSYHAYPYKGKLSDGMLDQLEAMAQGQDCVLEFRRWVQKNIVRHGR